MIWGIYLCCRLAATNKQPKFWFFEKTIEMKKIATLASLLVEVYDQ